MKLVLPLPPNRANARWHWRTEKRKKDAYFMRCMVALPKRPRVPFARASMRVTAYTHQEMDVDNLNARMKWPLDWLVRAGFIVDDSPKNLDWLTMEQQVDRKNQRIEVELEEIE